MCAKVNGKGCFGLSNTVFLSRFHSGADSATSWLSPSRGNPGCVWVLYPQIPRRTSPDVALWHQRDRGAVGKEDRTDRLTLLLRDWCTL